MANSINVNQNNNNVSLQDTNGKVTITDDKLGINIEVTQPVTNIVTVSTIGPQGQPGEIPSTGSFVLTSSFNEFTASYYLDSASFNTNISNNSSSIALLSGSFEIFSGSYNTGSFTGSFTGDLNGTSSYALNAESASYALTASYAANVPLTASYALNAESASYAQTASYVESASYSDNSTSASHALNADTASNILGGKATHVPYFITDTTLATSSIYQSGSTSVIINQDENTTANPEALYVWQPHPTSINVISGKGNLDSYLQLNIQNTNQGEDASSDIVATANNGNELDNYIDMGINSENFDGFLGGPNDSYLYAHSKNMWIGNINDGYDVNFFNSSSEEPIIKLTPTGQAEITGSLFGTSSWAENSITASYAITASHALNVPLTASYAISASHANNSNNSLNSISASHAILSDSALAANYATTAGNGGVTSIIAGAGITLLPPGGTGNVTIISSGGGGVTIISGSNITSSFVNSDTWTFNHGLGIRTPTITVFDSNYNQIIPQNIELTDTSSATITFPTLESGFAVAMVGGVAGNAYSSSYSLFSTYADTASFYNETDPIFVAKSGSYATTGSNRFNGNQIITGSLTVSGSNTFTNIGPAIFSGSINISGSLNIGTLTYTSGGISNSQLNENINLLTQGSGSVNVNSITFPSGSLINTTTTVEEVLTNYSLVLLSDYSTGSLDALPASQYNTINGLAAPWTAFQLTSSAPNYTPVSSIEVDDILAGVGIIPSSVKLLGGSGYEDIIIVELDLSPLGQLLPTPGTSITSLRATIRPTFTLETPNNTNLFLNANESGSILIDSDFYPLTTNTRNLGIPTRRWKEVWVGPGSIYVQDETLGIDLRMTAKDGNFVVDGAAGFNVGQFTFINNQIKIDDPNEEIIIGTELASGSVTFNRPLRVNTITGTGSFEVDRTGRTQLVVPNIPANDVGAFSIIGNSNGTYQPIINPGGMIHVTSNDNQAARVTIDGFGSNIGAIFVGRHARGTSANPTPTISGDILARYAGLGYATSSYFPVIGAVPTSLEFQATENYSTSSYGSRAAFYTYANGAISRSLSAVIDTTGITIPTSSRFFGTASWAENAQTSSYITTAQTASYVLNAVSASYAQTASYVTGSIFKNGNLALSASYAQTASYVLNAQTASYIQNAQTASYILNAVSSSYSITSSYAQTASYALTVLSASYALTSSYVNPLTQDVIITGSLKISGSLTEIGNVVFSGSLTLNSGSALNINDGFYVNGNKQFNYAQFAHTASIPLSSGVSSSFQLPLTYFGSGVSIVSGSRITFANTGVYNIHYTATALQGGTSPNLRMWFKKTGSNINNSSVFTQLQANTRTLTTSQFGGSMNAGEYIELWYHSSGNNTSFPYTAAGSGFPAAPSILVTVTQVA